MGSKPKAGGNKKRAANAPIPKAKKKGQRQRFIDAARDVGVDETGKEFERALAMLVPRRER